MGETVLLVAVLLLALYGCVELTRELVTRMMAPRTGESGIWVIPVSGHRADIEYVIRSATVECRWAEKRRIRRVWLLDMGLDAETRRIAEKLCEETDGVGLCRPAELNLAYREDLQ